MSKPYSSHLKPMILFVLFLSINICGNVNTENISLKIKHAETYYWLGIEEDGNMEAFSSGIRYLDSADSLTTLIENDSAKTFYLEKIKKLRTDILKQADMAHDTFFGFFPLVRFIGSNIFTDSGAYDTFELIDDPDIIVVTKKISAFTQNIISTWRKNPQLDVIIISEPRNIDYENEIRYLLNKNNRFFVHNDFEINSILSENEIQSLNQENIPVQIKEKICTLFDNNYFLIINIKENDIVDDIYFYQIEGRIYSKEIESQINHFRTLSLVRDRTTVFISIWIIHLLFIVLSFLVFVIFEKYINHEQKFPSLFEVLTIPTLAYFVGRIIPWFTLPMLTELKPEAETLAILSFWWVIVVSVVLYLSPVLIIKITISKFKGLIKNIHFFERLGIVFLIAGLGVNSFLALPILLYGEFYSYLHIALLTISSSINLLIIGKSIDETDKQFTFSVAFWATLNLSFITLSLFSVIPNYLWINLIISLILYFYANRKPKLRIVQTETHTTTLSRVPITTNELLEATNRPTFYETDFFINNIWIEIEKVFSAKPLNNCIILEGEAGIGKTGTAKHILNKIVNELNLPVEQVIQGNCKQVQNVNDEIPYSVFSEAFGDYFGFNILSPPKDQLDSFDSGIDELVNTVLPFVNLFSPNIENNVNNAESKQHLLSSISKTISLLSKKKPLIIFLDDIQWIDSASYELLIYLLEKHNYNESGQVLFILTSRKNELKNFDGVSFSLKISKNEKIRIIQNIGLSKDVSQYIITQLEVNQNKQNTTLANGNLHWIFRVIRELVNLEYLKWSDGEFIWTDLFNKKDGLPIPEDFISSIREILSKNPEYSKVLEPAACIGDSFSASLIDYCLDNIGRIKTISILRDLENNTGLIYDDTASDDFYSFQSSFTLEAIRSIFNITSFKQSHTNQIIIEYHSRIAKFLENLPNNNGDVYEIANHYYLSGKRNVQKTIEYLFKSSKKARNIYQYEKAKHYISLIEDIVKKNLLVKNFEIVILTEKCRVAFAERDKKYQNEVANFCNEYLQKNELPNYSDLMEFVIALFYGNNFSKQVLVYSEMIIKISNDPFLKAEATQFFALVNHDFNEKINLLKQAVELLNKNDDVPSLKLKARIADSIGNAISNKIRIMNIEDSNFHFLQQEAIDYYSKSIEIKEMETISDLTGLTLSYGGLGRCYFAGFPKESGKVKSAISHFKKDLEISESISQLSGIIMMHSSLGECYYSLEQNEKSYEHYTLSYKYSSELLDKYFALIGLIKVSMKLGNKYENYFASIISIMQNDSLPNWVISNFIDEMKNIENKLSNDDILKIKSFKNKRVP